MLDETEKEGVFKILELLSLDNLISLTDTVTGKVVTVESKEEALNATIIYTRNGEELLKRRKVRREHLYQYLAQEGYVEHPAADKTTLLKKILKLWESRRQKGDLEDGEQSEEQMTNQPEDQMVKQPEDQMVKQPEDQMAKQPEDQMVKYEERPEVNSNESTNSFPVKPNPNLTAQSTNEGQLLAVHFSAWFYQLLESLSKALLYEKETPDWGPQHFWQDAKLTIQCNEPSGTQESTVEGAQLVSEKFLAMVVADQLCFNPNLTNDSVQGKQDPHGLTLVIVCGTVHKQKQFIGVFEQSFGLIRDPTAENNWKIKFSKLMLKASACGSNNKIEGTDT